MRIVVILLAALLICSMFATVYKIYPAHIENINIYAGEPLLPGLLPWRSLEVVSMEPSSCDKFFGYYMMRFGNTILVRVFNLETRFRTCLTVVHYTNTIIPLGSCFPPGVTYRVEVNNLGLAFSEYPAR